MDRLESYRDLCKEIELWEIRLEELQDERTYLLRKMSSAPITKLCASYSGMPGAGMMTIDFPRAWREAQDVDGRIDECKDILSLKREAKRRMERVMENWETLEYKVAYMRDVEQKKLEQIAIDLGYSYDWIRRLSMRVKRLRVKIPS